MNQIRELTKDDWREIERSLDVRQRSKIGQLKIPLIEEFYYEFSSRLDDGDQVFVGRILTKEEKEILRENVLRAINNAIDEIATAAFGRIFGSKHASFGVKSLNDPIRLLGIQATLRRCNFSDDLSKCPVYPNNCCAPTTGFCPKKK